MWRPNTSRASVVSIVDPRDNRKIDVDWPAGAATIAWPEQVPFADGGRYLMRMKGRTTVTKVIAHRVLTDMPSDAHRAAWMADNGCRPQARRLLAGIR